MLFLVIQSQNSAKSNAELRKKKLFEYTKYYIICFIVMILCLGIVPFFPQSQGYYDFILQGLLLVQIIIYM